MAAAPSRTASRFAITFSGSSLQLRRPGNRRAANDRPRREIPLRRTWYMRHSRMRMLLPNFIRILTLRSLQALLV